MEELWNMIKYCARGIGHNSFRWSWMFGGIEGSYAHISLSGNSSSVSGRLDADGNEKFQFVNARRSSRLSFKTVFPLKFQCQKYT